MRHAILGMTILDPGKLLNEKFQSGADSVFMNAPISWTKPSADPNSKVRLMFSDIALPIVMFGEDNIGQLRQRLHDLVDSCCNIAETEEKKEWDRIEKDELKTPKLVLAYKICDGAQKIKCHQDVIITTDPVKRGYSLSENGEELLFISIVESSHLPDNIRLLLKSNDRFWCKYTHGMDSPDYNPHECDDQLCMLLPNWAHNCAIKAERETLGIKENDNEQRPPATKRSTDGKIWP